MVVLFLSNNASVKVVTQGGKSETSSTLKKFEVQVK
jgi:hypothetical protein